MSSARSQLSRWAAGAAVAAALGACSPQDRSVGAMPAPERTPEGTPPTLQSAFVSDEGSWEVQTVVEGARVRFGAPAAGSADDAVVELRLPGGAGSDASDFAGPAFATEIGSKEFLRFGTLRTAVRFPTCLPSEEVAAAVFWFYNDGVDHDGDGLTDNPEMDLHVLCGTPGVVVLTAWTDYQENRDGSEQFLRRSRAVDLSSGDVYDSASEDSYEYAHTGSDSALVRTGFPAPGTFYEVGYDWQPAAVRFFIVIDGKELTLWTLTDAAFIPQVPLQLRYNLWHSDTHWVPAATPASYPSQDAVLAVDGFEYWAP
jgi:hypothetical protein